MKKRKRFVFWMLIFILAFVVNGCHREELQEGQREIETPGETEVILESESEGQWQGEEDQMSDEDFQSYWDASGEAERIMIASDIHYFGRHLTDRGDSFQTKVFHGDGKVTNYVWELTSAFVDTVIQERPDVLILSGDLSLDGERESHEEFAEYLHQIEEAGISVAVIPGNHDINNPHAVRFRRDKVIPVDHTTPEEFEEIYQDFGYKEALSRDAYSLSYTMQVGAIRLLMIDSCQYQEKNLVGGMIRPETYDWMKEQLEQAVLDGVTILPVAHHNLLEESEIYEEDCTIEHNEELVRLLDEYLIRLFLSGHLHVQHYANSEPETENGVWEIVTSSLMTPPCQYGRLVMDQNGAFAYATKIMDVEQWAEKTGQKEEDLLKFSQYRVPFLGRVFYNQAHDVLNTPYYGELFPKLQELCEFYARANAYYYWGRAYEIAEEIEHSPSYEIWQSEIGGVEADYLNMIRKDAVRDYNRLRSE